MPTAVEMLQKELNDVEAKLSDYDELVQQRDRLRAALSVLEGTGPITPGRTPQRSSGTRSRRSSGPIDEGEIIHAIHTFGEPAPAVEIRKSLGLPDSASNSLSIKLRAMVDAGALERVGERRNSRYSVPS